MFKWKKKEEPPVQTTTRVITKTWHTPGGKEYGIYHDAKNTTHLLIAGTTGSGKSVMLNGIMTSLMYDAPSESKVILIDPKMVELYKYAELPHCIGYGDRAEDILSLLQSASRLMENRYLKMKATRRNKSNEFHLYIIIDELADLLLLYPNKKELLAIMQHIIQLGRAANIHMIMATQCPNRKTIPAEIVLNTTDRVALRCLSSIESRQIIGECGAEKLPRYGECLWLSPDGVNKRTVPMVDDDEINRLIDHWMQQAD